MTGARRVYRHRRRHALARRYRCGRRVRVRAIDRGSPDGGRAATSRACGRSPSSSPRTSLTWDRVELATGAVDHEAAPVEAEPRRRLRGARRARGRPSAARRARGPPAPGACGCPKSWSRAPSPAASSTATCCTPPAWSTRSRSACAPVAARRSSPGSGAPSASSPSATATCSTSPARRSRARCGPPRRAGASSARSPTIRRRAPR